MVINVNLFDGDGIRDWGLWLIRSSSWSEPCSSNTAPYFGLAAILSFWRSFTLKFKGISSQPLEQLSSDILLPIVILLLAASAFIWVVVGNLEKNLERAKVSEAELKASYDLTLEAWQKSWNIAIKRRKASRRLVDLSTRLAKALGPSTDEIVRLQRGALLHDIGKLAIPDEILLKPGELERRGKKADAATSRDCKTNAQAGSFSSAVRGCCLQSP